MSLVNQIALMVDTLPAPKQNALMTIIQSMIDPDDHLTEEDVRDIREAREEFARGEYVRFEDVKW